MLEGGQLWWWGYSEFSYDDSVFLERWEASLLAENATPGGSVEKVRREATSDEVAIQQKGRMNGPRGYTIIIQLH